MFKKVFLASAALILSTAASSDNMYRGKAVTPIMVSENGSAAAVTIVEFNCLGDNAVEFDMCINVNIMAAAPNTNVRMGFRVNDEFAMRYPKYKVEYNIERNDGQGDPRLKRIGVYDQNNALVHNCMTGPGNGCSYVYTTQDGGSTMSPVEVFTH